MLSTSFNMNITNIQLFSLLLITASFALIPLAQADSHLEPATVPDAPTDLTAIAGDTEVSLSWTAPINDGSSPILDYLIQYSIDGITWITFTDGVSVVTSATVTGLTNDQSYDFRVSSINKVGINFDEPSNVATATPTAVITVPYPPTDLIAIAGDTQVSLSWTAPLDNGGSPITNYFAMYSLNGATNWITFAYDDDTTATAFLLTNDVEYYFTVQSENSFGISYLSAIVTATPTALITATDAPIITSLVVDDPDDLDRSYSIGDTITITFDVPTNMPGGTDSQNRTAVNSMFTFSQPHRIASAYSGQWTSPDTFTITLHHVSDLTRTPSFTYTTVTPAGIIPILSADETSEASNEMSPVLTGDFG